MQLKTTKPGCRCVFLFLILIGRQISAQESFFKDGQLKEEIRQGVDCIYNYNFEKAREIYKTLVRERPNHPVTPVYYSMILYWENYPLTIKSRKAGEFVDSISRSILLSERMLKKDENSIEGIFFDMVARLMLVEYYADNDLNKKVFTIAPSVYKLIRSGFTLKDEINDFYYSTGMYNYYREAYPEANPRFRALAILFPKGDKKLGLLQLDYSGRKSIFLGAESISILYYIFMFYEKNYSTGLEYADLLNKKYPNNPLYLSARIQLLLLMEKYEDATISLAQLAVNKNSYFEMIGDIFKGVLEEKKNKNYVLSQTLYESAISISNKFDYKSNEQLSFAYFGLSRLYSLKGEIKKSKEYRKTANSLTSFRDVNFD
jgi:hypothetical protein